MVIALNLLKIIVGFVFLIKGADFFVDGAASIAKKLGVPELVIGLTIVALGTSAPEAAVSINAALTGNNGISIGNVIGSNIMNVLLILGITSIIKTLPVKRATVKVDIPFMIIATITMVAWGMIGGKLTRVTGIVFLVALVSYILYLLWYSKNTNSEGEGEGIKMVGPWLIPIFVLGGLFVIILGSRIAVDGASHIAEMLGVSNRIIGLTIVAFGTSLPELMTSITAARKGSVDIAIGNIVGSNLFNILFILGITSTIIDLPYLAEGADFTIDGFVALGTATLLFLLVAKNKRLGRKGGIIMVASYAAYFAYLVIQK